MVCGCRQRTGLFSEKIAGHGETLAALPGSGGAEPVTNGARSVPGDAKPNNPRMDRKF